MGNVEGSPIADSSTSSWLAGSSSSQLDSTPRSKSREGEGAPLGERRVQMHVLMHTMHILMKPVDLDTRTAVRSKYF